MSVEMSQSLVQELEILKEVYCDELEIRPNQNFLKLKVKCMPLLEDKNVEHHYEFDNPYLFATIDVPNDYPTQRPKIHLETTHSKIAIGSHIADLTNRVEELLKAYSGDPCIVDTIEFIRAWLYGDIAKKSKHFKKRRHLLSDQPAYLYDDEDDEDNPENLQKRAEFTEVTQERFDAWLTAFRAESRIKQERDPSYLRQKMTMTKPSGRHIFNDRAKELSIYFNDDKNEDDDEEVDLRREMQEGDSGEEEELIDIDEDVFGEEDDLGDEDFIVDDN